MFTGLLPKIPNVEFGFRYDFGPSLSSLRTYADLLKPVWLNHNSSIFIEGRGEYQSAPELPDLDLPSQPQFIQFLSVDKSRTDISMGGGYRRLITDDFMVGVNGFYDTSRIFGRWYGSGGIGLESVTRFGNSALDLNFNWYGNLLSRESLVNAFRNMGDSYDFEIGYSHGLLGDRADLRLKVTGYNYYAMSSVIGWKAGVDLTSRDGLISVSYQAGHDKLSKTYHSVGGTLNFAFDLESVFYGENPLSLPEPVFQSPRNLQRNLLQKVRREWRQPSAVAMLRNTPPEPVCDTDRIVAAGPLTKLGKSPGRYSTGPIHFDPVPHTCLEEDLFASVSFDYEFDSVPSSPTGFVIFAAAIRAPGGFIINWGAVPVTPSKSGSVVIPLVIFGNPEPGQLAFTSSQADPAIVRVGVFGARSTNTLRFPNGISVKFNQN
jgi:hypothetical protein